MAEQLPFGERLALLRKERSLSQQQIADELGVRRPVVAKWEAGRSDPKLSSLARIAEVLGCSIAYLVGETEDTGTAPSGGWERQ